MKLGKAEYYLPAQMPPGGKIIKQIPIYYGIGQLDKRAEKWYNGSTNQ